MGRPRGAVEMHLDDEQVAALAAALERSMPEQIKGKLKADASKLFDEYALKAAGLNKEAICDNAWALDVTYAMVPKQPIHAASLFKVFGKLLPAAEAQLWLIAYDYKALMQRLGMWVQFNVDRGIAERHGGEHESRARWARMEALSGRPGSKPCQRC